MSFKKSTNKKHEGLKPGTYVTLYNGKQGIVTDSDKQMTTIKELDRDLEFTFSLPTSQAKLLVNKDYE